MKDKKFKQFMITTALIGLAVFIVVFLVFFAIFSKDNMENQKKDELLSLTEEFQKTTKLLGVITKIDYDKNIAEVYDIIKQKDYSVQADATTVLKDKYGNPMVFAEYEEGDMVEIKYNEKQKRADTMNKTAKTWEVEDLHNVKIDDKSKEVIVGNDTYVYDDKLVQRYQGKLIDISKIVPTDVFTIRGYEDKIYALIIKKFHGYITFKQLEELKGADIEIDNNIFIKNEPDAKVLVSEGSHKIVIKKENIEPVVKNITVKGGETVEIDVTGEIKKKFSNILLTANVEDYDITLTKNDNSFYKKYTIKAQAQQQTQSEAPLFSNNTETSTNTSSTSPIIQDSVITNNKIVLEYGTYNLEVTKAGYKTTTQTVKIYQPNVMLNIKLEQESYLPENYSEVSVETNPSGAEVYVENEYIGVSPLKTNVMFGESNFKVVKNGYVPIKTTITIDNKRKDLLFNLQKEGGQ